MLSSSNHPYFEALFRIPPPTADVWGGDCGHSESCMQWQLGLLQHWHSCSAPAADVLKGSTAWRLLEALLCFSCQPSSSSLLRRSWVSHSHPSLQAGRNHTEMGRSHWHLHCACKALNRAGAFGHKCELTPWLPNSSWLGFPTSVQPLAVLHGFLYSTQLSNASFHVKCKLFPLPPHWHCHVSELPCLWWVLPTLALAGKERQDRRNLGTCLWHLLTSKQVGIAGVWGPRNVRV